jgi:hypothetical protein
VGARLTEQFAPFMAEDEAIDTARISAIVYAGTTEAAEDAAVAYANTVARLTGAPQLMGDTGVLCLVHDRLTGPQFVAQPGEGGEEFAFEVAADFVMLQQ